MMPSRRNHVWPSIAEPTALGRELVQPLEQRRVIRAPKHVAKRLAITSCDGTCLALD